MQFDYFQPTELVFGCNKIKEISTIIKRYGKKVLLVGPIINYSIKPMLDRVINYLHEGKIETILFLEVEPNPSTVIVDKGLRLAKENNVDVIVALGGGSSIDTAKIISLCFGLEKINWQNMFKKYNDFTKKYDRIAENKMPLIVIPTTAGTGSQCTHASVITDCLSKMKNTIFHHDNYPDVAIIDPQLSMTLPLKITVSTAFDAFTHAFEAYLKNDNNIITEQFSLLAINYIVKYLPKVIRENKIEYRERLSIADTLAGIALSNNGAALPHPVSEIIGSYISELSHGEALAIVYPSFIKHTNQKYQKKFAKICRIFDNNYKHVNDVIAAEKFYEVIKKFQKENYLEFYLKDFVHDQETLNNIKNCDIWNRLTTEKTETVLKIIDEICEYGG